MAARKPLNSFIIILVATIILSGCIQPRPTPTSARELYDYAQEDLKKGRYEEAKYRFEKVLKEYPNTDLADNALFRLGYINIIQENYEASYNYFGALLQDYENSEWKFDAQTWLKLLEDWKRLKSELENAREQLGIAQRQAETSDRTENDTAERIQELQDEINRLREENNNLRMLIENLEE